MTAEYHIPIRLKSTANLREHWAKKHKRMKAHRQAAIIVQPHPLPCVVTIVRVGKRFLDTDNLANAGKGLRDGIADRLGVDDADPRVTWKYEQQKGDYAAIVRIEPR